MNELKKIIKKNKRKKKLIKKAVKASKRSKPFKTPKVSKAAKASEVAEVTKVSKVAKASEVSEVTKTLNVSNVSKNKHSFIIKSLVTSTIFSSLAAGISIPLIVHFRKKTGGSNFESEQKLIDYQAFEAKPVPSIKPGSENLTASEVSVGNLIAPKSVGSISFKIVSVKKSTTTPDGTAVSVVVRVFSTRPFDNLSVREYTVEVSGFLSESKKLIINEINDIVKDGKNYTPLIKKGSEKKTNTQVGVVDLIAPTHNGLLFELDSTYPDKSSDGEAVYVNVRVSSKEYKDLVSRTYIARVTGFKSTKAHTINLVQQLIDKEANTLKTRPIIKQTSLVKNPPNVKSGDFILPVKSYLDFAIKTITPTKNPNEDWVDVVMVVSSNSTPDTTPKEYTVRINGFVSMAKQEILEEENKINDIINQKIAISAIQSAYLKLPKDVLASDIILPTVDGIKFEVKSIVPYDNSPTNKKIKVTISVASTKIPNAKARAYTYVLDGFSSLNEYVNAIINDYAKNKKLKPIIKNGRESISSHDAKPSDFSFIVPQKDAPYLDFEVSNVISNPAIKDGTSAIVTVIVKPKAKFALTTYKEYSVQVDGFSSSDNNNNIAIQKIISDTANVLKTPPTIKSKSKFKINSEVVPDDFIVPTAENLAFTIKGISTVTGNVNMGDEVLVTIEVSASPQLKNVHPATYSVIVGGFTTFEQRKRNLIVEKINDAKKSMILPIPTELSKLKSAHKLLDSDFLFPFLDENIESSIVKIEEKQNVNPITDVGKVALVTIKLSSKLEDYSVEYIVEISSFANTTEAEINEENQKILDIVNLNTVPIIKPSSKNKTADVAIPSDLETITIVNQDPNISIKIVGLDIDRDNDDGAHAVATIEVSSSVKNTKKMIYTSHINGFKTYQKEAEETVDRIVGLKLVPEVKTRKDPATGRQITADKAIATDFILPQKNDVTFSFDSINESSAKDGTTVTAIVKVTYSKRAGISYSGTYTVDIPGFTPHNQATIDAENKKILNFANITKTPPTLVAGANQKTAVDLLMSDFQLPTAPNGLQLKIVNFSKAINPNDGTTVSVVIEVSSAISGTTPMLYTVNLGGLISEAQKLTKITQEKIDKISTVDMVLPVIKKGREKDTAKNIVPADLSIISNEPHIIFQVQAVNKSTVTPDGTTVTATINVSANTNVSNVTPKTYTIEVPGFLSEVEKLENDTKLAINGIVTTKQVPTIVAGKNSKTANDTEAGDFVNPTSSNSNISIEVISSVKASSTADGSVALVTVKVSSSVPNVEPKYYTVEVPGFTTETQKAINDETVLLNKAIQDKIVPILKSGKEGNRANITSHDFIFPSIGNLVFTISNITKPPASPSSVDLTVTVTSTISGVSVTNNTYIASVGGFTTNTAIIEENTRNKINEEVNVTRTSPSIKSGSESKTATDATAADLVLAAQNADGLDTVIVIVAKSNNTTDGSTVTVTVKVSSSVPNVDAKYYTVEVLGFTTETQKEINDANTAIDNETNSVKTLPSIKELAKVKTAIQVVANDFVFPSKPGLQFSIKNIEKSTTTPDGSTVTLTIEVTSDVVGTMPKSYTVEVPGFLTEHQRLVYDINQKIEQIATVSKTAPNVNQGQEEKTGSYVTKDDFNFNNKEVEDILFSIVSVSKMSSGDGSQVNVTIRLTSDNPNVTSAEIKSKTYHVIVSSFKTKSIFDAEEAQKIINKLAAGKLILSIKDASKIKTNQQATADDFILPTDQEVQYKITNVSPKTNAPQGSVVEITVEISSVIPGTTAKEYTVIVSGFRSINQENIDNANSEIKDAIIAKHLPTIVASSKTKTANLATISDLVPPTLPAPSNLTFTIINVSKSKQTTDGSTVTAIVKVSSNVVGSEPQQYAVDVFGFTLENNYAIKKYQDEVDQFSLSKILPKVKTNAYKKTASNVLSSDLFFENVSDHLDFKITVSKDTKVSDGSQILVNVVVSSKLSGVTSKTYDVEINGFLTEAAKLENDTKLAINGIVTNKPVPTIVAGKNSKTASDAQIIDFVNPTSSDSNISIEVISSVKAPSTLDGSVALVTVKISSSVPNVGPKYYTVEVPGFTTEIQKAINDETALLKKAVQDKIVPTLKSGKEGDRANITPNDFIFPSIGNLVFTISNITKPSSSPSAVNFLVTVTSTNSGVSVTNNTYNATVEGFTTNTAIIEKNTQAKIDKEVNITKTFPTIKSGSESKTAIDVTASDLVLAAHNEDGLDTEIITVAKSNNTTDGSTVTVTIKVSSSIANTLGKYYTVEVQGFTAETQKEINDANTAIDNETNSVKTLPSIKELAKVKTAIQVVANDFVFPSKPGLQFSIKNIEKSATTTDGSTVTLTIEVTSDVVGTAPKSYTVEVPGFLTEHQRLVYDINQKIEQIATITKTAPNVNQDQEEKTGSYVTKDDFNFDNKEIADVVFTILSVSKTSGGDGSQVDVTIRLTSDNPNVTSAEIKSKTYHVIVSSFKTEAEKQTEDSQALIDQVASEDLLKPTVKLASRSKTAANAQSSDLVLPTKNGLIFTIVNVEPSAQVNDGSTVNVTMSVSSAVPNTVAKNYNVEVSGFVSNNQKEIDRVQAIIDRHSDASNPTIPTLTQNANQVNASYANSSHIILPTDPDVDFEIISITRSKVLNDGTSISIAIKVSSQLSGTTPNIYFIPSLPGFLSDVQQKINEIDAKINKIADDSNILPTINKGFEKETVKNIKPGNLTIVSNDNDISLQIMSVDMSSNNSDGSVAKVTIQVSSNVAGTITRTYIVDVPGFTPELQKQINDINDAIILEATQTKTKPTIKSGSNTKTAKDAGINDIEFVGYNNPNVKLEIVNVGNSVNITDGSTLSVVIRAYSDVANTIERVYVVDVQGFKNLEQENIDIANKMIDEEVNKKVKPTIKPDSLSKTSYEIIDNDFIMPDMAYKNLTFKIINVKDLVQLGDEVELTIEVSSDVNKTTPKTYQVVMQGFTKLQARWASLVNEAIIKRASITKTTPTIVSGQATKTPQNVTSSDLEIHSNNEETVTLLLHNGNNSINKAVTLAYDLKNVSPKDNSANNDIVDLIVEISSSFPNTTIESYTTEVGGFKSNFTKNKEDADADIQDAIDNLIKPTIKKGREEKTSADVVVADLVPPSYKGLIFAIKSVTDSSKVTTGTDVEVTLEVSSTVPGSTARTYTVDVTGFTSKNKKEIERINDLIAKEATVTRTKPTINQNRSHLIAKEVSISDVSLPTKNADGLDLKITHIGPSLITTDGTTVTIVIEVSSTYPGTTPRTYTWEINGFTSNIDRQILENNNILKALTISSISTHPTAKNKVLIGVTPTVADLNPPSHNGFVFIFTSATPVDDNGVSNITYDVDVSPRVAGTTLKSLTFNVSGFETKSDSVQRLEQERINKLISDKSSMLTVYDQHLTYTPFTNTEANFYKIASANLDTNTFDYEYKQSSDDQIEIKVILKTDHSITSPIEPIAINTTLYNTTAKYVSINDLAHKGNAPWSNNKLFVNDGDGKRYLWSKYSESYITNAESGFNFKAADKILLAKSKLNKTYELTLHTFNGPKIDEVNENLESDNNPSLVNNFDFRTIVKLDNNDMNYTIDRSVKNANLASNSSVVFRIKKEQNADGEIELWLEWIASNKSGKDNLLTRWDLNEIPSSEAIAHPTAINKSLNIGDTPVAADINSPIRANTTFNFVSATPIDSLGKSLVTYEGTFGGATKNYSFMVVMASAKNIAISIQRLEQERINKLTSDKSSMLTVYDQHSTYVPFTNAEADFYKIANANLDTNTFDYEYKQSSDDQIEIKVILKTDHLVTSPIEPIAINSTLYNTTAKYVSISDYAHKGNAPWSNDEVFVDDADGKRYLWSRYSEPWGISGKTGLDFKPSDRILLGKSKVGKTYELTLHTYNGSKLNSTNTNLQSDNNPTLVNNFDFRTIVKLDNNDMNYVIDRNVKNFNTSITYVVFRIKKKQNADGEMELWLEWIASNRSGRDNLLTRWDLNEIPSSETIAHPTAINKSLNIGDTPVAADINPPTRANATFVFDSATPIDSARNSIVTYNVTSGGITKKYSFAVPMASAKTVGTEAQKFEQERINKLISDKSAMLTVYDQHLTYVPFTNTEADFYKIANANLDTSKFDYEYKQSSDDQIEIKVILKTDHSITSPIQPIAINSTLYNTTAKYVSINDLAQKNNAPWSNDEVFVDDADGKRYLWSRYSERYITIGKTGLDFKPSDRILLGKSKVGKTYELTLHSFNGAKINITGTNAESDNNPTLVNNFDFRTIVKLDNNDMNYVIDRAVKNANSTSNSLVVFRIKKEQNADGEIELWLEWIASNTNGIDNLLTRWDLNEIPTTEAIAHPTAINKSLNIGDTPVAADINLPTRTNATFVFDSATPIDSARNSIVTYDVTSGGITKKYSFAVAMASAQTVATEAQKFEQERINKLTSDKSAMLTVYDQHSTYLPFTNTEADFYKIANANLDTSKFDYEYKQSSDDQIEIKVILKTDHSITSPIQPIAINSTLYNTTAKYVSINDWAHRNNSPWSKNEVFVDDADGKRYLWSKHSESVVSTGKTGLDFKASDRILLGKSKVGKAYELTLHTYNGTKINSVDINLQADNNPTLVNNFDFRTIFKLDNNNMNYLIDRAVKNVNSSTDAFVIFRIKKEQNADGEIELWLEWIASNTVGNDNLLTRWDLSEIPTTEAMTHPTANKTLAIGDTPVAANINPPTRANTIFVFDSATPIDSAKNSFVTYDVTSGGTTKKYSFIVTY